MKHYQKYSTVVLVKKGNFNYEISIACCNSCSINIYVFYQNMDYANCMEATKLDYISKEGADHISAQCNAFIKQKIMVK